MADFKLDDDVRDVLSRAECAGSALRLPLIPLDRKLYERVDKALRNAGGKWNTKAKAHIFPTDVAPKLAAMLGTGVSIDEKKRDQSFFTPPSLAVRVVSRADVTGQHVLEPSAGLGSLVAACLNQGALSVFAVEIDVLRAATMRSTSFRDLTVKCANFLQLRPEAHDRYDRIVMNPPFTKNQDIAHVRHALKWLAPGGILVAIMANNVTRKGFAALEEEYDPGIEDVERGAFKESGTDVPTIIVKIET